MHLQDDDALSKMVSVSNVSMKREEQHNGSAGWLAAALNDRRVSRGKNYCVLIMETSTSMGTVSGSEKNYHERRISQSVRNHPSLLFGSLVPP